MDDMQLLGLDRRWPRLMKLEQEVKGLEQRLHQAQAEVSGLQAQLQEARTKDLDREAQAVRSGKKPPAPKFEAEVKSKLESRQRDAEVLERALEAARSDLAKFTADHQRELYEDAVSARTAIAQRMAEHISRGLREYTLYADSFYVPKRLAPPPPVEHDESARRPRGLWRPSSAWSTPHRVVALLAARLSSCSSTSYRSVVPSPEERMRLEKKKELEADIRLRRYFERLSHDPSYDYAGREQDLAMLRRKWKEGREWRR